MNRLFVFAAGIAFLCISGCAGTVRNNSNTTAAEAMSTASWSYGLLSIPQTGKALPAVWRSKTEFVKGEMTPSQAGWEPSGAAADSLYRAMSGQDVPGGYSQELDFFNLLGSRGWQLVAIQNNSEYQDFWFKKQS